MLVKVAEFFGQMKFGDTNSVIAIRLFRHEFAVAELALDGQVRALFSGSQQKVDRFPHATSRFHSVRRM
jgi:hypothetical protein